MVASVDLELEVYELLEQVDHPRQRVKVQAAIIGLLVRVLRFPLPEARAQISYENTAWSPRPRVSGRRGARL